MKEVTKKDLPEVSGGDFSPDGCIPYPILPARTAKAARAT
jgi:hypothetical protein